MPKLINQKRPKIVKLMKQSDTFVTFLEGVFEGHFFDIVVVDFGRVWFCHLCKNRFTNPGVIKIVILIYF